MEKKPSEVCREICEKAAQLSGRTFEEQLAWYEKAISPEYVRNLRCILDGEADE